LLACSKNTAADDIYMMIARDEIFIDLYTFPLGEPAKVHVYPNEDLARIYTRASAMAPGTVSELKSVRLDIGVQLSWDGKPWTLLNIGDSNAHLKSGSPEDTIITIANHRLDEMMRTGEISVIAG